MASRSEAEAASLLQDCLSRLEEALNSGASLSPDQMAKLEALARRASLQLPKQGEPTAATNARCKSMDVTSTVPATDEPDKLAERKAQPEQEASSDERQQIGKITLQRGYKYVDL